MRDGARLDGRGWAAAPVVPPRSSLLLPAESLPWAEAAVCAQ